MQDTIRKTMENTIIKSKQEVGFTMTTNIVETLPWIDYRAVFAQFEERGKAEGKAERDMEIALKAFGQLGGGKSLSAITSELKDFGIPDDIIEAACVQTGTDRGKL